MDNFDTINFKCPECGTTVTHKTKSGSNMFGSYNESSVPKEIANAIMDFNLYCPGCGDRLVITLDTHTATVPLFLRKG